MATGSLWQTTKALAREPWCFIAILFLGYIAQAGIDKYLLEGAGMSQVLPWLWTTVLSFPQRPLVQLFMIPLALWMFMKGVRRVEAKQEIETRKQEEETKARAAAMAAVEASMKAALALPNKIAACWFRDQRLGELQEDINRLRDRLQSYRERVTAMQNAGPQSGSRSAPINFDSDIEGVRSAIQAAHRRFGVAETPLTLSSAQPVYESKDPARTDLAYLKSWDFVPDHNKPFFAAHVGNMMAFSVALQALEKLEQEEQKAVRSAESEITAEVRNAKA